MDSDNYDEEDDVVMQHDDAVDTKKSSSSSNPISSTLYRNISQAAMYSQPQQSSTSNPSLGNARMPIGPAGLRYIPQSHPAQNSPLLNIPSASMPIKQSPKPMVHGTAQPVTAPLASVPYPVQLAIHERSKLVEMEEDKAFIELLQEIDSFDPIIPDQLTDYFMTKAGLDSSDIKIKRLLALITQKYMTDIAQDALQYCKVRSNIHSSTSTINTSSGTTSGAVKKTTTSTKEKKLVLTMDDLQAALSDYGIDLKKPPSYR